VSDRLTCPDCGETFRKSEAAFSVCLTCGEIFPPGEEPAEHGPGPGNGRFFGECCMSVRLYSVEDAEDKQAEVREAKAEKYYENDLVPPWEHDDTYTDEVSHS